MLIYTGGAKGVDTHVERLCHLYGHTCVVFIPPCHPRSCDYHVIQPASLVLALGHFDELGKHLLGGTGWSVVMAQLLGKPLYVFDVDKEQWFWWNPDTQHYQPCEGMTETQIALPTLQDKTAIVSTREEDQVLYPTLESLFKRQ